ncbi:MAG: EutN/CcmL family microcompartment protein [Oscillospiraceae bacterium]|jgi:ethanolamine utilization protein EutN/carbon dioxide concentrating mechanism protein CcmL|nr:EutN/CcmL family microcompartment protein [Oscillospiraceae bacterium]
MILARVKGNVVSTTKSEKLSGYKLLIVTPVDADTFEEHGSPLVSVDTVGAGEGEVVLVVGGSSSRQTAVTENRPVDSAIVAVVDSVDIGSKRVYEKYSKI